MLGNGIVILTFVSFGVAVYALIKERDRPITPIAVLLIAIVLLLLHAAK